MAVFGDTLRQARAYKGVTLKEAEQATRINRHHLAALEDENFGVLPPLIYQRGIVRNYATYLELDPGKLLAMFEEARGGEATAELVVAVKPLNMPSHWAPNFAIIAFMVVMSAIVFAWGYSAYFAPAEATSTVPALPPTVTPIPAEQQLALLSPTAVPPSPTAEATVSAGVRTIAQEATGSADTPEPTPRTIATRTPKATATPSPTATPPPPPPPTEPPALAVKPAAVVVEEQPEQEAPQGATATIRVIAQADISVTIEGDGQVLYSGWLGAGTSTDWFTASSFAVTTTDGSQTLFENAETGQQFYMGYGPNETYYLGG